MSKTDSNADIGPPSEIAQKLKEVPASIILGQPERILPSIENLRQNLDIPSFPDSAKFLAASFRLKCMNTTVKEIVPPIENVIFIRSTDSVTKAFETLITNKLLSVPLLEVTTNNYVAFLHLLDILAYIIDIYQYHIGGSVVPKIEELIIQDRLKNTPVSSIVQRALRNPWYTINEDCTIQEAIEILNKFQVYQLAITDKKGRFYSVLTQFRFVVWLAERTINEFGDLGLEPIECFGLGYKPVARLHKSRRVLDAFLQMDINGISGIAITDDNDKVIGNISISDLKDIGSSAENIGKLYLDCASFIESRSTGQNVPKLIWANRASSIKEVLGQFRAHYIHRVYVIEARSHYPVGVITTTDIIALFASALKPIKGQSRV